MRLMVLGMGWLAGLFAASRLGLPPIAVLALMPLALSAVVLGRRHWRPMLFGLLGVAILAGALRFSWHERRLERETITAHTGEVVELRGVVAAVVDPAGRVLQFHLRVRAVLQEGEWRPETGLVRVSVAPTGELVALRDPPYLRPGDVLHLKGRLESPEPLGEFDFASYLANQGMRSVIAFPRMALQDTGQAPWLDRAVFAARSRLSASLEHALPEPQSGLARALTVGFRDGISPGLSEDFRRSGTTHLLAISGLHVAVIAGMALALSRRFFWRSQLLVYAIPIAAAWGYALLAGLPPSAQRAAIMATVYFAARVLGRQRHGFDALILAAVLITLFNPSALRQVSFQLSFLAMAGIVLISMPLMRRLEVEWTWGSFPGAALRGAVVLAVAGFAATVFTWPAIALYFRQVSLMGVPATMAAMPVLPLAIVGSLLTALLGLISGDLAAVTGWAVGLLLSFEVWTVRVFASIPAASLTLGQIPAVLVWSYYALLGGAMLVLGRSASVRARWTAHLERRHISIRGGLVPSRYSMAVFSIVTLGALAWGMALWRPAPLLEVDVLDVGQGDAILLKTPSGQVALVDGGRDGRVLRQALGHSLAFQQRRIEVVIATHAHEDHIGGLAEGLAGYSLGMAIQPAGQNAEDSAPAAAQAWQERLQAQGVRQVEVYAGYVIRLGDVRIDVLNPPEEPLAGTSSDVDNNSLVLRVEYGRVSFLLTGDIRGFGEDFLVRQGQPLFSSVLKVAHHGSETSTSPVFLDAVRPSAAVISVGEANPFGQPHVSTLEALRARMPERALFATARDGTVSFFSDGRRVWVETERP